MNITRFAQSCFLIEAKEKRILIDPSCLQYTDSLLTNEWKNIDAIFVTHKHADHCHVPAIQQLIAQGTAYYASKEVANEYPEISPEIVKEGDIVTLGELRIEVVKAVHGYIPEFKGAKEIHENIGFIVDDGKTRVYHTSDSVCFDHEYTCDILLAPVSNHGIVMGPWEAARFAQDVGATVTIPMHYDHPKHPVDKDEVKKEFDAVGAACKFLAINETYTCE